MTPTAANPINNAVGLWRSGRRLEAERLCIALLSTARHQADARGLLAEIYSSNGEFGRAAEQLRHVASLRPTDASIYRRLGDAAFAAGEPQAAADSFRHAIELEPQHPRAHNNLGRALLAVGDRDGAIASYRRAVDLDPKYAIAHLNLGVALADSGQLDEALACYDKAIGLNPKFAEAYSNQGNLRLRLNHPEDALASYNRAIALEPLNATLHAGCGNALLRLGRFETALSCYEQALRLKPDSPEVLNNRGTVLHELKRLNEALASHERALALQPDYAEALSNRAYTLLDLQRFEEATSCCDELLRIHPNHPAALLYRGTALQVLSRYAEAADCFERLLHADPAQHYILGYLLHATTMVCDWSRMPLIADAIREIEKGKPAVMPLALLALTDSAAAQLQCARNFVTRHHAPVQAPIWEGVRWKNDRIRLAYVSGDFREHALSALMVGVFEKHRRERFETIAISLQPPVHNSFGQRIVNAFDVFMDVHEQSDLEVAQLLNRMQVDIVIDLMGLTRGQRFGIFAHRPVPVQVSYLGYPGTVGAPYIDYIVADDYVIPPESRKHYSEHVVYLPDCFQANDDRRAIAEQRPTRAQAGLPENAFVFCSFNSCYKLTPAVFDTWCRLLAALPDSVLWMLADSEAAQDNLRREATLRGVDPKRLIFAGRLAYDQHLARMQLADLFLDCLPFNAGTTASDALWAGVPVLTCSGEAFAARMGGSLLRAVGLPELITDNLQDYEQLALHLASSPAELYLLRERLAHNRQSRPLFDTELFCRRLESAYTTMYERYQRGEMPAAFAVE